MDNIAFLDLKVLKYMDNNVSFRLQMTDDSYQPVLQVLE